MNDILMKMMTGRLFVAPLGSAEPQDLTTAWPVAWVGVGPTSGGHEFGEGYDSRAVEVLERRDPVDVSQGSVESTITFSTVEHTSRAIARAFQGTITTPKPGVRAFEPSRAVTLGNRDRGVMVGWEALDGTERWVFRRCVRVDDVTITRAKTEQTLIPLTFRCLLPDDGRAPWRALINE